MPAEKPFVISLPDASPNEVVLPLSTTTSRTPMLPVENTTPNDDEDEDDVDPDEERDEFVADGLKKSSNAGRKMGRPTKCGPASAGVARGKRRAQISKTAVGGGGQGRAVGRGELGVAYGDDEGEEEMPRKIRLTIVFTAVFLLLLSFILVGVTLKMAPVIDQMGTQFYVKDIVKYI
jgi:hypothetical protein